MPTSLDLKPGRHYRVAVTGFALVHYIRGADDSERRCARRQLKHGEVITCLQSGTPPKRTLKFRTADGVEGTWFPTDSEGRVPSLALEPLGPTPTDLHRSSSPPTQEAHAADALETHLDHPALNHQSDTDSNAPTSRGKLPPLQRLKRAWQQATSGERIAFMEWLLREEAAADERTRTAREDADEPG